MSNNNQSQKKNKKNQKKNNTKPSIRKRSTANIINRKDNYGSQLQSVAQVGLGKTLQMYPSTMHFGRVYGDPFSKEGARMPVLPIMPTKMLRTVASGTGIFNSSGYFMITTSPVSTVQNDQNSVFYSNNAASPPFITNNTVTYTIGASAVKSPYTGANFTYGAENSLSCRIVAHGIRVKYTGTVLNASGTCFMAQTLPKVSMNSYAVDDIKSMQGFKEYPFRSGKWHSLIRHITQECDKDYLQYDTTDSQWVNAENHTYSHEFSNYLGMICQGVAGASIEWEVVTHFEIAGPNIESRAVGHVDSVGTEKIINGFAKKRDKDSTTIDHTVGDTGFTKLINTIVSGAEKILPMIPSILSLL